MDNIITFPREVAELDINKPEDAKEIIQISEALSNPLRIEILNVLQEHHYTIPQLAKMIDISITDCVFHTSLLSKAGLIRIELVPGEKRNVRMCYRLTRSVDINLFRKGEETTLKKYINYCRVGEFINYSDDAEIRYATKDEMVLFENPYSRKRYEAELIWSVRGTISYGFPNPIEEKEQLNEIDINLEICSEVADYNNKYKSDITFWINNIELFTYTSPGDYGDRKGLYNPEWWSDVTESPTQYGDFVHIQIKKDCIYVNDILVRKDFDINALNIKEENRIILKLGNKKDAVYKGGWNIFGKSFGNYPIDIEMEVLVE